MSVKSGQALSGTVVTSNPTTGAAADATGTPTATLYVNGAATLDTVTVTKPTGTGIYKWAVTLPTLTAGDTVSVYFAATVAAVAGAGVVFEDVADTKRVSDLNDLAAGAAMTLTSAYDSAKTAAQASTALLRSTWTDLMAGYLNKLGVAYTPADVTKKSGLHRLATMSSPVIDIFAVVSGGYNYAVLENAASALDKTYDPMTFLIEWADGKIQEMRCTEYFGATRTAWFDSDSRYLIDNTCQAIVMAMGGDGFTNAGRVFEVIDSTHFRLNNSASEVADITGDVLVIKSGGGADGGCRIKGVTVDTHPTNPVIVELFEEIVDVNDTDSVYAIYPTAKLKQGYIAQSVWADSETYADGTKGDELLSASLAGDPLAATVPGSYGIGTAGRILGTIDPRRVVIESPVSAESNLSLYRGASYLDTLGTMLEFTGITQTVGLTDVITFVINGESYDATYTAPDTVTLELTAAETALFDFSVAAYSCILTTTGGEVVVLFEGSVSVSDYEYAPPTLGNVPVIYQGASYTDAMGTAITFGSFTLDPTWTMTVVINEVEYDTTVADGIVTLELTGTETDAMDTGEFDLYVIATEVGGDYAILYATTVEVREAIVND